MSNGCPEWRENMHKLLPGLAVLAVLGANAAMAQDAGNVTKGKFYLGAQAGVVLPEDVNFSGTSSSGGITTTAAGTYQFKDGYSVSGLAGYHLNDYVRGEAELGYSRFEYDSISLNGNVTSNGTTTAVNGSASMEGTVSSAIGMVHGIVAPLGKTKVSPLLGAGIGFAATEEKITRIGTLATNFESTHTDLAVAGMVGAETNLSDQMSMGLRYRYMWIDSGTEGRDDFTAHNFVANAAWKF
ncbi:hypothetical protein MSR1L_17990 [Magnetospirillum gryphiswaldense]|nr:hypothetical protein MSR1L_17990 [Magnetospirillum gryphiswaldense]